MIVLARSSGGRRGGGIDQDVVGLVTLLRRAPTRPIHAYPTSNATLTASTVRGMSKTTTKTASPEAAAADSETRAARALLDKERSGVLCTAHCKKDGWPFGSVVPYAVLPDGDPVVWISDLAEHTKNLDAEPRASLFVADGDARSKPQTGARLSMLVRAERPTGPAEAAAKAAYFARFPEAEAMSSAHGFFVFVLRVVEVRWIAGFGSMGWISHDAWAPAAADPLAPHSQGICDHMNADHAGSLVELLAHFAKVKAASARMTSVDRAGFEVEIARSAGAVAKRVRIAFPAPVSTPDEVRRTVIAMLGEARKSAKR
jgi:putative heme iron utilization protein